MSRPLKCRRRQSTRVTRELAHSGHYPAIDVLQSVSRLATQPLPPEALDGGNRLREPLAAHRRAADLIAIGAYVPGSDPRVDEAQARMGAIEGFLRQHVDEVYDPAATIPAMLEAAGAGLAAPTPVGGPTEG